MQEKFEDDGLNQAYAEYAEMPNPEAVTRATKIGTLIFNRDDSDSEAAFIRATKADRAYGALYTITEKLRQYRKYHEFASEETSEFFYQLNDELIDIINGSGINFDNEYF